MIKPSFPQKSFQYSLRFVGEKLLLVISAKFKKFMSEICPIGDKRCPKINLFF